MRTADYSEGRHVRRGIARQDKRQRECYPCRNIGRRCENQDDEIERYMRFDQQKWVAGLGTATLSFLLPFEICHKNANGILSASVRVARTDVILHHYGKDEHLPICSSDIPR